MKLLLMLVACLSGGVAVAEPASDPLPVVKVEALRDVDEVPYKRFLKGMEVFDQNSRYAPSAQLRFRLFPRAKDASFAGLELRLVGKTTDVLLELDADHSFTLPQNASLVDDDVYVRSNKKAGTFAWRVDIRTPGLEPGTRRLGDLRLECKVDMKGAELRRMVKDPSIMALAAVADPCTFRTFQNPFFADKAVFNVKLVSGQREESISAEWMYGNSARAYPDAILDLADWRHAKERLYVPPIADQSWPDDTVLKFDYMEDPV